MALSNPNDPVLAREVTLPNLVDRESFGQLLRGFADMFGIGARVLERTGACLAEVRAGGNEACRYVYADLAGRDLCRATVLAAKEADEEETTVVDCPATGARYLVVPILYDGDPLGRVIYGPFVPAERASVAPTPPGALLGDRVAAFRASMATVSTDDVRSFAEILSRVIDVILYASYKALLTSNMHIETVEESYRELEEKNRRLQTAFERLKELDRMKSQFLATMSHELRTPLTSIIGYSELLAGGLCGEMNEEQQDYVHTIQDKGEGLLQMINSILDISKIESGTLVVHSGPVEIEDVLQGAVSTLRPLAAKKSIALNVESAGDLPIITGDREKLGQVFANLLNNAVKFTPKGGSITLRVERRKERLSSGAGGNGDDAFAGMAVEEKEQVLVGVQDTGIGIPADKLDRVFESFFQVDGSSTREYGGAGLGLAIVRNFVAAHGGRIWVESTVGKGSTFFVALPVGERVATSVAIPTMRSGGSSPTESVAAAIAGVGATGT